MLYLGLGVREGTRQTPSLVREHRKAKNATVASSAAFHVQGLSCSYYQARQKTSRSTLRSPWRSPPFETIHSCANRSMIDFRSMEESLARRVDGVDQSGFDPGQCGSGSRCSNSWYSARTGPGSRRSL